MGHAAANHCYPLDLPSIAAAVVMPARGQQSSCIVLTAMRDLTQGPITKHILVLATPVAVSMLAQLAYQMIDLYFVSRISAAATAGVSAASNTLLIVSALAQTLNVGITAVVARSVGAKDWIGANLVFNQSLVLASTLAAVTMAMLHVGTRPYLDLVGADMATVEAGAEFMIYALPGFALLLPLTAAGSALRGTGVVQPYVAIHMITIVINAALAPLLIAGWGTGKPLGVAGAGLATSISVAVGITVLGVYLHRMERYLTVQPAFLRPRLDEWGRIIRIGFPAGCDFALTFLSTAVVFLAIRDFGAAAQAGFGIGTRVLQVVLLPGLAIGFAAGPIAGQNLGAVDGWRVWDTFHKAALISSALMALITLLVQWQPHLILSAFDADPTTLDAAASFLQLMSWTFVAQGLVYVCTNMFQGLGNTQPSLISSGARFAVFSICVTWMCTSHESTAARIWSLLSGSFALQAFVSLWLLRREFRNRVLPLLGGTAPNR